MSSRLDEGKTMNADVQTFQVLAAVAVVSGTGLMIFAVYWANVGLEKIQYANWPKIWHVAKTRSMDCAQKAWKVLKQERAPRTLPEFVYKK